MRAGQSLLLRFVTPRSVSFLHEPARRLGIAAAREVLSQQRGVHDHRRGDKVHLVDSALFKFSKL